jgi:hypothetical protein
LSISKQRKEGILPLIDDLSKDLPEGFEWSENELQLIALAQSQLDDVEALERALEAEGAVVKGSTGQPRLNPIFTEVRGGRLAAARIISMLKINTEARPGRGNRNPDARRRI